MKDYRVAYVTSGHSDYNDEVWKLLSKRHRLLGAFPEFDYLYLADCFVLAGADIRTRLEDDEAHVEIFIDAEDKAGFMTRLDSLITEKYAAIAVLKPWRPDPPKKLTGFDG